MPMPEVKRLFLCRHGQTFDNLNGIWCGGERESSLTANGVFQAKLLGNALKNNYLFRGGVVVSSSLKRARETAVFVISKLSNKPITNFVEENLREYSLGNFNGKTTKEILEFFPNQYCQFRSENPGAEFRIPGSLESMEESRVRITKAFERITGLWLLENDNPDLIIITHGGTNTTILLSILKIRLNFYNRIFSQNNACTNVIHFRDDPNPISRQWLPEIIVINDTYYLSSFTTDRDNY